MPFAPSLSSLAAHRVPAWFEDAKLGIFVHWTMSCVPAFAPQEGPMNQLAVRGVDNWMSLLPYAEWYENALRFPDSPTARFHRERYRDAPYANFRVPFEEALLACDTASLADLVAASGARYSVLVTKHHDGYCLWDTKVANSRRPGWNCPRDIVGEYGRALRERGLRYGLYYSAGIDWTFNQHPIGTLFDIPRAVPGEPDYRDYALAHCNELIDRYAPDVLWNDIAFPGGGELLGLLARYYNDVPDGVINDRWAQPDGKGGMTPPPHYDFSTPEYTSYPDIRPDKWEACRGIGNSFGYAANEDLVHSLDGPGLVRMLVDAVSKNGNLLLNLGPRLDGTVLPAHERVVRELGAWLAVSGEAIYGTRPWIRAEGTAVDEAGGEQPVRFTAKDGVVYMILLGTPAGRRLRTGDTTGLPQAEARLLGGGALASRREGGDFVIDLERSLPEAPAHAIRLA